MRLRVLGLSIVCFAACSGQAPSPSPTGSRLRKCGVKDLDVAAATKLENKLDRLLTTEPERVPGSVSIKVHAHVITNGAAGQLSEPQIQGQIAQLNTAYSGGEKEGAHNTAYRFVLASYEQVDNAAWYNVAPDTAEEREMKTALRRGGVADLNIYFAALSDGLLGWATFPWDYVTDPQMDGIVVLNDSIPGGPASVAPYNLGDTAVHEAGHWLGLYHPFQNGCASPSDGVKDTPWVRDPNYENVPRNSCPGSNPPLDPWDDVTNYMDYCDDLCMDHMTHGQGLRMNRMWKLRDAVETCGNGQIDPGEVCDPASDTPCPTSCDDGQVCTTDTLVQGGTCQARCEYTEITEPQDGDGCCPTGANHNTDSDCPASCGNGEVEDGETCDPGAGSPIPCPTSCDDGNACTTDTLHSGGTCNASCSHDPVTLPTDDDGCCPPGGNANSDNDCAPVCGNSVIEAGEACDDGNTNNGDGCSSTCQVEVVPPTGFRVEHMWLRDPHVLLAVTGCNDVTDTPIFGISVNGEIEKQITTDADGNGYLDLSLVGLMKPLRQSGSTDMELVVGGNCTAPVGPSTTCSPGAGNRYPAIASSQPAGTCLGTIAGTTNASYSPTVTETTGPCFSSDSRTLAVVLNGVKITLHDARIAGTWNATPATSLANGLLRGFISETDANATIIPLPVLGNTPLSKLLPGGSGNCAGYSDKDTAPDGTPGWYFYLNFTAVKTPWTE